MRSLFLFKLVLFLLMFGTSYGQFVVPESIPSDFKKTIYTSTVETGNHTTLLSAIEASDMDGMLDGDAPFTIFAPSDKAFKKLSSEKIKELLKPENKKELQDVVAYHMVAGNLSASKILRALDRGKGTASFTTVQGNKIKASMEGLDIILSDSLGNKAKITVADGDQCNGVLHIIDSVILPRQL